MYDKWGKIDVILVDVSKGESNRNPMKDQHIVEGLSHSINECAKNFCVANKWLDLRPLNTDVSSNLT